MTRTRARPPRGPRSILPTSALLWRVTLAVTILAWVPSTGVRAQQPCEAWPGEIEPLPNVNSANGFEARWAALRAKELETLARALGPEDPVAAHRLWRHVRCLQPDASAPAGVPADIRPRIAYRDRPVLPPPAPAPRPSRTPTPNFGPTDRALESAETELADARFKRALSLLAEARALLEEQTDSPPGRERLARLEVMSATALIALGRSEDAEESFARALAADPELQLDDATTSPKIVRFFSRVRSRTKGDAP